MKKFLMFLLIAALILGALTGVIVVSNNRIAAGLKDQLLNWSLPEQTEPLSAKSVAGKLTGAGNGMQYRGALLVRSDLTKDELLAHYQTFLSDDGVFLFVDSLVSPEYGDLLFPSDGKQENVYQIMLFRNMAVGTETSFWESLLNCDLRGH